MQRPIILVTNDDGYDAPGIQRLATALEPLGRVIVVAPDRERSASGHALTLHQPLRLRQVGSDRYTVDGTPTDCVHLAVPRVTGDRLPDLVCSGINMGLNLGDDVTYSGTVAGAREGTFLHVPAIAFSSATAKGGGLPEELDTDFCADVARRVLDDGLPEGVLLNVNLPAGLRRGVRITRQGTRTYRATSIERHDPNGKPYYWIDTCCMTPSLERDGDHQAIEHGYASITPLHVNATHEASMRALADWADEERRVG